MESANHEFTWMSGRAQLATTCQSAVVERTSPSIKDDDDDLQTSIGSGRPTPLPRATLNQQYAVNVQDQIAIAASKNKSSPSAKRPIPLPRIFRRLSSSSSSSAYSTTCSSTTSLDNNYDAVSPATCSSNSRGHPTSSTASTFYVATTTYASSELPISMTQVAKPTATCVVDKSVIFEFDRIMQKSECDDQSTSAVNSNSDSTLSIELEHNDNSLEETETQECDIYLPSETSMEELDAGFDVNVGADSTTSSALQRLPRTGEYPATAGISRPLPKPRQNAIIVTKSPGLPPKSANSVKFGLSTVPPPPVTWTVSELLPVSPGHTSSDSSSKEDNSVSPKISPIHIDNPCYMFVMPNSGRSCGIHEQSSDEDTNDEVSNKSCELIGPPERRLPSDFQSLQLALHDDYATPPNAIIHADQLQCPPAPRRPVVTLMRDPDVQLFSNPNICQGLQSGFDESIVDTTSATARQLLTTAKSRLPPYIPIYQNLLEICGSTEGIYAQIRKATSNQATPAVPPLPPRGQQRLSIAIKEAFGATNVEAAADGSSSSSNSAATVNRSRRRHSEQLTEVIRNIPHRGHLFRIGRNRKEIVQKWVVLERGHLQLYADDESANPQDIFHQSDIISVGQGKDMKYNHRDMPCFELTTRNVGTASKERPHAFGTKYAHERDAWVQHVVQSIAPSVSMMTDSSDIGKAGYVQVRKAVSGVWYEHWMVLSDKTLKLWSMTDSSSLELDLRKVTFMQEYESDPQTSMAVTDDKPFFVVHYPAVTLYALSKVIFDTTDWFRRLKDASLATGRGLDEQQLTHEDVPVVVDKCINFVSTYGISTKGIYRESGTNSKIARLVDCFHKDAWKVHISPDDYTEHDVANVLKRYLRTLTEALLTKRLYQRWIAAHALTKANAIEQYVQLLSELPRINYMTLKKLIAHLKSVTEQGHLNLMGTSNVAAIFGPTLLSTESDVIMSNNNAEVDVVSDLVANYATLFGVSVEEIEKEEKIQKALQDLREAKRTQKPAGDILVGIYIHSRHWGKCLNVKLSPTMAALDLCQYAIQQMRMRDRVENLVIYEIVCNEEMERPLHHSEIVLAVTLRWACWSDVDARDSYLLLKKSEIFHRIVPLARQPLSMFGELRFADIKSKSFKKFMFEFKNARLAYYKDATISQPLGSWNIEDITWYIGSDSRRQKPTEWSLTFIEQKAIIKRGTKETPYFGRTICFTSEDEFYRWMAAMLTGQYPNGILPKVEPMDRLT